MCIRRPKSKSWPFPLILEFTNGEITAPQEDITAAKEEHRALFSVESGKEQTQSTHFIDTLISLTLSFLAF